MLHARGAEKQNEFVRLLMAQRREQPGSFATTLLNEIPHTATLHFKRVQPQFSQRAAF